MTETTLPLFRSEKFTLENGKFLPILEIAFETYDSLEYASTNTILLIHG